jgi:integrase
VRPIFSPALGTGLRLAEPVGLNVGDVLAPDSTPRIRVRIRKEIAKGGRAADVFLPDPLVTKLKRLRGVVDSPALPEARVAVVTAVGVRVEALDVDGAAKRLRLLA